MSHYDRSLDDWKSLLPNRTEFRKAATEIFLLEESDSSELLDEDGLSENT